MGKALLVALMFLRTASAALAAVDPGTTVEATARHALVIQARQGDAEAQFKLGGLFLWGERWPQDNTEAASWYRRAAEHGHATAQGSLALMYSYGLGVQRDVREAARWYREAAEQGDADSQVAMALMYYAGIGVPKSKVLAYQWAMIADANPASMFFSRSETQEMVAEIAAELTASEIARAERLVQHWEARAGNRSQNTQ